MTRILMHGCNGKMGRMITELVKNDDSAVIAAGVDTYTGVPNDYPVFESVGQCDVDVDVVIDFSNAGAVDGLLDYCVEKNLPVLLKLLKDAAKVLGNAGYDIELVERHHNQKVDAPSGTALALADSINEALGGAYHYVYDRSQVRQKRDSREIGISAVRGGTIVGEHEVIFAGTDEVIEFKHTAYSRNVFAKGAVEAAKFLKGKTPGMYDMGDVIQF